jgi:peptide/nickel transport system permease protein
LPGPIPGFDIEGAGMIDINKKGRSLSPFWIALGKLKFNRLAMLALIFLCTLYLVAIFAPFIAPYHFDDEERAKSYNPPTKIHFFDAEGNFHLRPFVYEYSYRFDKFYRKVFKEDKSRIYPIRFFIRGSEYKLFGFIKTRRHLFGVEPPGRLYILGADSRGRDLFSRLVYGSRVSLSIGLVGSVISLILGMLIGGISGYFGGRLDSLIMRACEMIMMIPAFYLMLALRAAFPPDLSSVEVYILIVVIMSFIGWAALARVVRGMALSIREQEFVLAARSCGRGHLSIILRHILPNTLSYCIVALTLSIPSYILGESALSLLGLGIQDPHASWGNLLSEAMNIAGIKFHPWVLIPGVAILVSVMAFNLLGDALRDCFDPRMEVGRKF